MNDAEDLAELSDSRTFDNLKVAFSGDCQAAARYRTFASRADLNGQVESARTLLDTARGKELQAEQQLDFLRNVVDPQTGSPMGTCETDLTSALARATYEAETLYPGFARTAHEEGFDMVGRWFDTQADTARHHAAAFRRALESVKLSSQDEAHSG